MTIYGRSRLWILTRSAFEMWMFVARHPAVVGPHGCANGRPYRFGTSPNDQPLLRWSSSSGFTSGASFAALRDKQNQDEPSVY
jgi:hypothetical protein